MLVLLTLEYKFFCKQSEELFGLQAEYRDCILNLKQQMDLVQKDSKDLTSTNVEEKKKSFEPVNRELNYLKKSAIKYLQEKKLKLKADEIENLYSCSIPSHSVYTNKRNIARQYKLKNKIKFLDHKNRSHNSFINNKKLYTDMVFLWPLNRHEFWVSSFFGNRRKKGGTYKFHHGIDLAAVKGTTVKAAGPGIVAEASYVPGYGNTILLVHNKKYKTRYAHLHSIKVKVGNRVLMGQKIATVGSTGHVRSSGKDASHLHFEVYVFGKRINPLYVLP